MPFASSQILRGQRILVVEDSYLFSQELVEVLEREGADVVGPVATVDDAYRLVLTAFLDAAVLDVSLRSEKIWPVSDLLSTRNVRLVFATGYSAVLLKKRYNKAQVAEKPAPARLIARLLSVAVPAASDF